MLSIRCLIAVLLSYRFGAVIRSIPFSIIHIKLQNHKIGKVTELGF